jgi:maleate cis-trans isomerase
MSTRTATVGCIKPTRHSGSHADLVRLLPEGIKTTARRLNIRHGTIGEFESVMADYEVEVARFAAEGVDLIHPEGTPPFMLKGLAGEQAIVARWQDTHGVPVFTSAMSQADALRALGIARFVGVGYDFEDTEIVARYFRDAGFDVIALDRPRTTAWEDIDNLPAERVFELIRDLARRHRSRGHLYPGLQVARARYRRAAGGRGGPAGRPPGHGALLGNAETDRDRTPPGRFRPAAGGPSRAGRLTPDSYSPARTGALSSGQSGPQGPQ